MSAPSLAPSRKLTNIQHLRAVAALIVVLGHALTLVGDLAVQRGQAFTSLRLAPQFGVDVFFVISGFIMVYTSAGAFGGVGGAMEFMRRRLVRIVPVYWLATAVEAAILFVSRLDEPARQITVAQVLKSLLFFPYVAENGKMRPLLGVGWTLNFEMYFYIVFALGMLLSLRAGLVGVAGFMLAIVAAGAALQPGLPLAAWSAPIVIEFLLGGAVAYAFLRAPRRQGFALPAILPALALVTVQMLSPGPTAEVAHVGESVGWRPLAWVLAALVVASSLATRQSQDRTWVGKLLTELGNASYSLYLTHAIVFGIGETVLDRLFHKAEPPALMFVALFAASLATGWLTHIWVERPVTTWLNRRTGGRWPPPIVDPTR